MSTTTRNVISHHVIIGRRRPAVVRIAILAARLVLAAVFINAAVGKLTLSDQAVAGFAQLGGVPMLIFVGMLEVAGAVGLLVPVLSGFASIGTSALLLIITVVTAAMFGAALMVMPAGCLILSLVIAYLQRQETVRLAEWLRRVVPLTTR